MELLALFAAIDENILSFPGEPAPAELFMLREIDGNLALRYLWSGVARELPELLRRCWSRRGDALAYTARTRKV